MFAEKLIKPQQHETTYPKITIRYRPNPKATAPRSGARLTQPGGTTEQIHSALVLMKYNMQHGKEPIKNIVTVRFRVISVMPTLMLYGQK